MVNILICDLSKYKFRLLLMFYLYCFHGTLSSKAVHPLIMVAGRSWGCRVLGVEEVVIKQKLPFLKTTSLYYITELSIPTESKHHFLNTEHHALPLIERWLVLGDTGTLGLCYSVLIFSLKETSLLSPGGFHTSRNTWDNVP